MATREKMNPNKAARIAGVLYLIIFSLGIFGQLFVRESLIVPGDAATTVDNILGSESLFRLTLVTDLIRSTCLILLPLVLYKLLKPVNKTIALVMVILALISVGIAMVNMINDYAVLLLLSGANYLTALEADQLHAQVMFFLDLQPYGAFIPQFLSLWVLLLGYLVFKSGFLPRILGILLILASLGFVIDSATFLLFPDFDVTISLFTIWGELLFALWLLIKGVNVEEWEKRALESA